MPPTNILFVQLIKTLFLLKLAKIAMFNKNELHFKFLFSTINVILLLSIRESRNII